jgi:hypothetical protein
MTTDQDQFDSLEERVREVARIAGVVAPELEAGSVAVPPGSPNTQTSLGPEGKKQAGRGAVS